MQIEIKGASAQAGPTRCPYCWDDVDQSVTCAACGARYHPDCAEIFVRCAALGCSGRLRATEGLVAIPRLASLARRVWSWRGGPLDEVHHDAWLVTVWPSPVHEVRPAAAEALARLLGPAHSPYDGRLRLQLPYPEPVVRADTWRDAQDAVAALRRAGVRATAVRLGDLFEHEAPLPVTGVDGGPPLRLLSSEGWSELHGPRLVLQTRYCEERTENRARRPAGQAGGAGAVGPVRAIYPTRTARPEFAALVYQPGERPLFLRSPLAAREGPLRGWREIGAALCEGAEIRRILAVTTAPLLALSGTGHSLTVRDNLAALLLIGRLVELDWLAERRGKDPVEGGGARAVAATKGLPADW